MLFDNIHRLEQLFQAFHLVPSLNAIENVMSNASKIMVDVEGGNNMLYLPLDRLSQSSAAVPGVSRESVRSIADAIVQEVNDRVAAGRIRDSR